MAWWHGLQNQVLDWGIDGWKLDGCDTFFSGRLGNLPVPFNRVRAGWMTTRQYMDHYARNEYAYGLTRNPEFVILTRSVDRPWSHPEGFAPLDAAPVTWVGDNRHTWSEGDRGIEAAIADILRSARLGYCVVGSDVAGYHGRSNPEDTGPATAALLSAWKSTASVPEATGAEFGTAGNASEIAPNIYIRWAQFSAFCGLFLNGGHGERRLWKRSRPELEIIRKFSWLHTELLPYLYSHVVACHQGGTPLIRPQRRGRYHYLLGADFLVAAIHEDNPERTVSLPPGRWRYLFDDDQVLQGPSDFTRSFPLDEYPVFIHEGAIVPLTVTRDYTGWGDSASAGYRTWLIYPHGNTRFTLRHPETHPRPDQTTVEVESGASLRIELSGKPEPHILRIFAPHKPAQVTLEGRRLAEGDSWTYDASDHRLVIRMPTPSVGRYDIVLTSRDALDTLAPWQNQR
jgi:alpha-D-xyloside xylohydrolase